MSRDPLSKEEHEVMSITSSAGFQSRSSNTIVEQNVVVAVESRQGK